MIVILGLSHEMHIKLLTQFLAHKKKTLATIVYDDQHTWLIKLIVKPKFILKFNIWIGQL